MRAAILLACSSLRWCSEAQDIRRGYLGFHDEAMRTIFAVGVLAGLRATGCSSDPISSGTR
jgi:hypothetical protein